MGWGNSGYGTPAWGGKIGSTVVGPGEEPPEPPVPPPSGGLIVHVDVGWVDYTNLLLKNTLVIENDLNSRKTCEFTLRDDSNAIHFELGEEVHVTLDGVTVFAGTLDETEEAKAGDWGDPNFVACRCADFSQYCDRHVVFQKYNTMEEHLHLRGVVVQIVDQDSGQLGEMLADDGIWYDETSIDLGPELGEILFSYETVSECFDQLADLTGYFWYVDANKKLHFTDITTYRAPYDLNPSVWQNYRKVKVRKSREKYRNIQYLTGIKLETDMKTNEFLGDGENRTFALSYGVASKPAIYINDVQVSADLIDVHKDDAVQDDIEWFYTIGEKDITQSTQDSFTPLSGSQTLKVTYIGLYDAVKRSRNDAEIAARALVENGSGVYVQVENDDKIDDNALADQKISGLLRRYGRIARFVEFETDYHGFEPGQRLVVSLSEFDISGDFLIERTTLRYVDNTFFRYGISAVSDESYGSWVDFFRNLARKRPLSINETETLSILNQFRDGVGIGQTAISEGLATYKIDPTYAVIGIAIVGGRRDSAIGSGDRAGPVWGSIIARPLILDTDS